ncbi:hypothetical protein SNEBB_003849 [Seison nebaliae]|nr:hypothetical protein SNEBB_003849 [Seison nebaliae]
MTTAGSKRKLFRDQGRQTSFEDIRTPTIDHFVSTVTQTDRQQIVKKSCHRSSTMPLLHHITTNNNRITSDNMEISRFKLRKGEIRVSPTTIDEDLPLFRKQNLLQTQYDSVIDESFSFDQSFSFQQSIEHHSQYNKRPMTLNEEELSLGYSSMDRSIEKYPSINDAIDTSGQNSENNNEKYGELEKEFLTHLKFDESSQKDQAFSYHHTPKEALTKSMSTQQYNLGDLIQFPHLPNLLCYIYRQLEALDESRDKQIAKFVYAITKFQLKLQQHLTGHLKDQFKNIKYENCFEFYHYLTTVLLIEEEVDFTHNIIPTDLTNSKYLLNELSIGQWSTLLHLLYDTVGNICHANHPPYQLTNQLSMNRSEERCDINQLINSFVHTKDQNFLIIRLGFEMNEFPIIPYTNPTTSVPSAPTTPTRYLPYNFYSVQYLNLTNTTSGPIQLWQFLLSLLMNINHQNIICWTCNEWEFKLRNPDEVARLWGRRKNKPKMNYEKLSRGLRYYYDKHIITKTSGKRYVYKYECDLSLILQKTPEQLFSLLNCKPLTEDDE